MYFALSVLTAIADCNEVLNLIGSFLDTGDLLGSDLGEVDVAAVGVKVHSNSTTQAGDGRDGSRRQVGVQRQ